MVNTPKPSSEEARIRSVIDAWVNALHSKDVDGFMSLYAGDNVMFILAPPLQYTPDNSPQRKGVGEWFSSFQGPITYEVRDLHITASESVAFAYSLNRISGTRTDGTKTDLWVRETLGFRKVGDTWKIVHQHESVPFYMDGSARAAIDLQP